MAGEGPLHLPCRIRQERDLAGPWGRVIARQEPLSIGRKGQGRHFWATWVRHSAPDHLAPATGESSDSVPPEASTLPSG